LGLRFVENQDLAIGIWKDVVSAYLHHCILTKDERRGLTYLHKLVAAPKVLLAGVDA